MSFIDNSIAPGIGGRAKDIAPVLKRLGGNTEEQRSKDSSGFSAVEDFLQKNGFKFRWNEVIDRVEFYFHLQSRFVPLTDRGINSIYRAIKKANISFSMSDLHSLLKSNFVPKFNPYEDYFQNLDPWDGETDYIASLASTVQTTQNDYWQTCLKKWLVAMVGCALKKEVANHTVIVFSGGQGIGKSTWLSRLIPTTLKDYYKSGFINPDNKDSSILLAECLLINLDELEGLSKGQIGSLKEMTTRTLIRERRAYARFHENYERRASFVASINKSEFLVDTTGNRRWLCFDVLSIDLSHSVNMDRVLAQAYHLLNEGFQYWFDLAEIQEVNKQNEQFELLSAEEELLLQIYEPGANDKVTLFMTTTQILISLQQLVSVQASSITSQRLGQALKKHGFPRVKKGGIYGYALCSKPMQQSATNAYIANSGRLMGYGG